MIALFVRTVREAWPSGAYLVWRWLGFARDDVGGVLEFGSDDTTTVYRIQRMND